MDLKRQLNELIKQTTHTVTSPKSQHYIIYGQYSECLPVQKSTVHAMFRALHHTVIQKGQCTLFDGEA